MEKPEQQWFLLSRNLSGEATAEEKQALQELLQQQPDLMQQYELLQRLWKPETPAGKEEEQTSISNILRRSAMEEQQEEIVEEQSHREGRIRRLYRRIAIAAGILIAASAIWYYSTGHHPQSNQIIAQKGSKTRTILPDGSTVWLNAGSSLQYQPDFSGPIREVTLQGEAFFDIVKMPTKPFIVHAGDINIKVLGTAFNVKSYAEENTIETTLIRGLVQVTREGQPDNKPLYLHPNQKLVLPRKIEETTEPQQPTTTAATTSNIIHLDTALSEKQHLETAWVYNRLEFRGESFEQLAPRLQRWYNITIQFEDEQVKQLVFNGSLENETVEQAMAALAAAVPFTYKIKDHQVTIAETRSVNQ